MATASVQFMLTFPPRLALLAHSLPLVVGLVGCGPVYQLGHRAAVSPARLASQPPTPSTDSSRIRPATAKATPHDQGL